MPSLILAQTFALEKGVRSLFQLADSIVSVTLTKCIGCFFIRLGARNLLRLILAQTFGHFRQK